MEIDDLRIYGISTKHYEALKVISKNSGVNRSVLMRAKIRMIVDSFEDVENSNEFHKELRITGIPKDVKDKLKVICKNLGVSESQLMRLKFDSIIESFPDKLKINLD